MVTRALISPQMKNMKKGRRLLFLDVDGVLNVASTEKLKAMFEANDGRIPNRSKIDVRTEDNPCEPHIGVLNEIYEKIPGLEIVLSSTWRTEMHWLGWNRYFATLGIKVPVTGCTPNLGTDRGAEVFAYLVEQRSIEIKKISRGEEYDPIIDFLVVDDDVDPCFDWIEGHWLWVDSRVGLWTSKDIVKRFSREPKNLWPESMRRAESTCERPWYGPLKHAKKCLTKKPEDLYALPPQIWWIKRRP